MSAVRIVEGDALARSEKVVAHGCNAMGKFNKGFAKAVRIMHPGCYDAYMAAFEASRLVPGAIVRWDGDGRTILNCVTQTTLGNEGLHLDYDAVAECMERIERKARQDIASGRGLFSIWPRMSMPRIGSGLGGGDWERVLDIVRSTIVSIEVVVHVPVG